MFGGKGHEMYTYISVIASHQDSSPLSLRNLLNTETHMLKISPIHWVSWPLCPRK